MDGGGGTNNRIVSPAWKRLHVRFPAFASTGRETQRKKLPSFGQMQKLVSEFLLNHIYARCPIASNAFFGLQPLRRPVGKTVRMCIDLRWHSEWNRPLLINSGLAWCDGRRLTNVGCTAYQWALPAWRLPRLNYWCSFVRLPASRISFTFSTPRCMFDAQLTGESLTVIRWFRAWAHAETRSPPARTDTHAQSNASWRFRR
jgi:hypothetical protein